MNKRAFIWIFFSALLVVACGEKKKSSAQEEKREIHPFLFNLSSAFSDEEFNLSFPIWFNDSLIRKHGIQSITRKVYSTSVEIDTTDMDLREVKVYTFDDEGKLEAFYVEHYYDNLLVGSMSFMFKDQDEYGFATVVPRKGLMSVADEEILEQYRLYDKHKYTGKYLVYEDLAKGHYLFCMLSETNWGPLSVDSILHPTKSDVVLLGAPKRPGKRYQVENRVNEFNVVKYHYDQDQLSGIAFDKYPFHYERSLLFNNNGDFTGFVDSTFSNNKYLTRREAMFHMEKELPVRLIHENKSGKSEAGYYQMETFEYTFYE